jgi:hypothetical protein
MEAASTQKPIVRVTSHWDLDETGKPWCAGTVEVAGAKPVKWRAYAGCIDPRQPVIFSWGKDGAAKGPTPEVDAAAREFALAAARELALPLLP